MYAKSEKPPQIFLNSKGGRDSTLAALGSRQSKGNGEENLSFASENNFVGANHKNDGPLQGLIDLLEKHVRRIAEPEGKMDYLLRDRRGDGSKRHGRDLKQN